MKIKLTKSSVYAPGKMAAAGETVEVTDRDGKQLVLMGRAVEVKAAPKPPTKKAKD